MNERHARRTIFFVFAAALAAQAAAAQPAAAASRSGDCPPSPSGVLRLYVINEAAAAPQTLDTAIVETSAIWATAGLHLMWGFPPAPPDLVDDRTIVVMIQRGLKRPPAIGAVPARRAALPLLGRVPFGEDGPGHLIQISFGAITSLVMESSYMDTPVAKLPDFLQRILLGRGLGRVLAHEIGHWLVGRGHVPDGLMRAALGERELIGTNPPRLPRAWTAGSAGVQLARSSRCESIARTD